MGRRKASVEPDTLRRWLELAEGESGPLADDVRQVLAPLFAKTHKRPVVAVVDFVALGREILGGRFVTPDVMTSAWFGKVGNMLRSGGVESTMEAVELLNHCASWVKDPIDAAVVAAKSGTWLAMARAKSKHAVALGDRNLAPRELEV